VVLVVADRPAIQALERATRAGVATAVFDEAAIGSRKGAHAAMADALRARGTRLIVLAGFARILDPVFFERLEGVPVINVHPALLPRFGGRGMIGAKVHEAVLASGATESGATVHRAEPGKVDEGEILVQRRVPVLAGDTPETLADRVLAQEHEALVDAIVLFVPSRTS
jgi:phosphoribosylglycinamide formyltransferase-1